MGTYDVPLGAISRPEMAQRLGVSVNRLAKWQDRGRCPVRAKRVISTGRIFYEPEDEKRLREWMQAVEDA